MIDSIETAAVPPPGGHYSQGTRVGDLIFVSGQLPIKAADGASFEDQAQIALTSLLAVVEAGGGDLASIAKVTAYIVGIDNWPRFNGVFAAIFGDVRPARAVVPVPELHYGYLVEVEAIAVRRTG